MDILTVVRDGAQRPTQIMFKANLSWKVLTEHLRDLLALGIITKHMAGTRLFYKLSEKGIGVLRSYFVVTDQFNPSDHYGVSTVRPVD